MKNKKKFKKKNRIYLNELFRSIRKKFRKKSKVLTERYKGKINGKDLFKPFTYANADMLMLEMQLFIIDNYLTYRGCILSHSEIENKIIKVRDAIKWILDNKEELYMENELNEDMKTNLEIIADFYKNGDIFGMWY